MPVSALRSFRLLLDQLDTSDRADVLDYFRIVHSIGEEVVDEVVHHLLKPTASRSSKLLAVETAFYHPWVSWLEPLHRILRHESDAEVFGVGVRALGRIGTPEANKVLHNLHAVRYESDLHEILSWEMVRTDPQEAFQLYVNRLMEGSANPRMANEAANELVKLANIDSLPTFFVLAYHEDLLITRHALRLVTSVIEPPAAEWLCMHLEDNHQMALADRTLKDWLIRFRTAPGPALVKALMQELEIRFGVRHPETFAAMTEALTQDAQAQTVALEAMKKEGDGILEEFLIQMLTLTLEGKAGKVTTFLSGTAEGVQARIRRTGYAIDTSAVGLLQMLEEGCVEKARVLPLLKAAFSAQTGREGVGRALGTLLDADDEDTKAMILSHPDSPGRGAALDAAGSRGQEALLPFLLTACRDSIEDISHRVILSLGRLEGAQAAALDLLVKPNLDDIYLGINILALNRMVDAVPTLLDYLENSTREEISLKVIQALGQIGAAEAAPGLMQLLHSGQSARLQVALTTCLRDIGDSIVALGLAERALELHQPQILVLAVEALIGASAKAGTPMEEAGELLLRRMILDVWEDRDPWSWRFRIIQALDALLCTNAEFYAEMLQVASAVLNDKRAASVWSSEQQAMVKTVLRNLDQRVKEFAVA